MGEICSVKASSLSSVGEKYACSWRGASKGCRQCLREWEPFYRLTVPGYEFWVGQKVPEQ